MDKTFSQTEKKGRTTYIDLPYNGRSLIIPQNHIDISCEILSISIKLFPVKTSEYVFRSYVKHFIAINLVDLDFTIALQFKDITKLEKLKELFITLFEFDDPKKLNEVAFNPIIIFKKGKQKSI